MKNFISYLFYWVIAVVLILELSLCIFDFSAKTMPTKNIDGNYLFEPGKSGYWLRGGLGEIKSYYQINPQGFNSILDYEKLNHEKLNIALIGDSYVQGFHSDVRNSVGRQLESILGSDVEVHEYGRAGSGIVDYALTYEQYIKDRNYDYVFVLCTDKDLASLRASNIGRGDRVPLKSTSRIVYDNFRAFRYININHGLGVTLNTLLNNGPTSIERINSNDSVAPLSQKEYLKQINHDALKLLPSSVIFLFENEKLNEFFIQNYNFQYVKIVHEKLPKDHGFDSHWNKNGRYNCALAMSKKIITKGH